MASGRATRLAPTPSGALHVGNARTFLVTWALARHEGWRIDLRLEDLDLERVKPGAHEAVLSDLAALGIDWDGPPIVQSTDLSPYRDALATLARRGEVFRCDRSRAEIRSAASAPHRDEGESRYPPSLRPPRPWPTEIGDWNASHRLAIEPGHIEIHDELLGRHAFDPGLEVGDLVVWTKLGVPAYQLAVVVDDARQGVTEVVRGDDLLPSAARQELVAARLGLPHARWWHLPLVHDAEGRRLAKRRGAHSLEALRAEGVSPARIVGWCAWSLGLLEARRPIDAAGFLALATPGALRAAAEALAGRPSVFAEQDLAFLREA